MVSQGKRYAGRKIRTQGGGHGSLVLIYVRALNPLCRFSCRFHCRASAVYSRIRLYINGLAYLHTYLGKHCRTVSILLIARSPARQPTRQQKRHLLGPTDTPGRAGLLTRVVVFVGLALLDDVACVDLRRLRRTKALGRSRSCRVCRNWKRQTLRRKLLL